MAQSQRLKRQRARQRERTRRQRTRQQNRTRRQKARQQTRQERIRQKGASGYYSPAGIKARGQVAGDLIGQGVKIAGMVGTGGMSSFGESFSKFSDSFGNRRDGLQDIFAQSEQSPIMGGGMSPFVESEDVEEKPFYQNPLVIAGGIGALLFVLSRRRK